MKEYTITYTADITEVYEAERLPEHMTNPEDMAGWIECKLEVDDVHVKNVKVFER